LNSVGYFGLLVLYEFHHLLMVEFLISVVLTTIAFYYPINPTTFVHIYSDIEKNTDKKDGLQVETEESLPEYML
jgi:hypothetical protein